MRVSEIAGERGEQVVYLGTIGGMGSVSLREAQSGAHAVPAREEHRYEKSETPG